MDDVPWEELPHDDYGPGLLVTIWTLAAVAGGFIGLRIYCKFSRGRGLWLDDHVLIASWCALLALGAFVTIDVSYDFGKHNWDITPGNWSWLLLYANLAGSFSIIAAAWSKTSFALTLLRITRESSERWMMWLVWFIIVSINIALGLSVLFTWIQCWPVEKTWRTASTPGTCWPKSITMNYNVFTASYSGAMDIVLAMLPWKIIWGLTMTKREKLGVLFAMSMGVFAGAVSFIKIRTIAAIGAFDIIDTVELVIWGAAESAVTIIAATIPILRALFRDIRPPAARFATDEELMVQQLGAAPLATGATPGMGRSKSDLELVDWKDTLTQCCRNERNLESRPWEIRDSKTDSRKKCPTLPPNTFKQADNDMAYSGSMELSRRLG
ncbi:integral membrane protein [Colletotrichum tofieldiae]|uniref:Integral membrane protein n=1 Tax=Colletotrichum tofieldiae TaxID=708197 RepID=A0A166WSR4_9PEZI|nr:integral membrane protein [Colletotrichum tofieldiae]